MNRQQRRATAKAAARNVMAEIKKREASGEKLSAPQEASERQMAQAAILQEYKNSVAWQKIATELHDHVVESMRWASEGTEDWKQLEHDLGTSKTLALQARFFTFECGLAFLDAVDPRPENARLEPRDVEELKAALDEQRAAN